LKYNKVYISQRVGRNLIVCAIVFLGFLNVWALQNSSILELEKKLVLSSGKERVNILNELSFLTKRSSYQKSRAYAEEALELAKKYNYSTGEALAISYIGFNYYVLNDLDNAEEQYAQALLIFQKNGDQANSANILNNIGLVNWKRYQFVSAFQHYREAFKIARRIGKKELEAEALNYIGLIYWKWSEYALSLDYFFKSLKLKEEIGDRFEIGTTLNNIALIYNEMNQPELSINYSRKVLEIAYELKDRYVLGRVFNNLGVSYFKQKDFVNALSYQNESLKLKREAGDKSGMTFSLNDLGEIALAQNNYDLALSYYNEALEISRGLKDRLNEGSILSNIAKVLQVKKNYSDAEKTYTEAYKFAQLVNNRKLKANISLELSNLYNTIGNSSEAYRYLKLYSSIMDSVLNQDTRDKIAELSVMYEVDQKESELKIQSIQIKNEKIITVLSIFFGFVVTVLAIFLYVRYRGINKIKNQLEEKNLEIAQKTSELETAISARNKFFSIVSHDLRSPFFGLKGMTDIIVEQYESFTEDERKEFLKKLNRSVKDLYLHLENLLDWSRIQFRGIELSRDNISIDDEIQYVMTLLNANAEKKKIKMINKVSRDIIVFADQKMVRSILQNLLSNAIKFTDDEGTIHILAEDIGTMYKISVADTGRGVPEKIRENLFKIDLKTTSRGTSNELGTGLGLIICQELVRVNGGEINFVTEVGIGTTFSFTLPKNPVN
jgi:signal transduction histidine kinase